MERRIVPHIVKDQELTFLNPSATVREAANLMAEKRIGAVLAMENDKLAGIFTERDVMTRVVAAGLDPETTLIDSVMTKKLDTVGPDDTANRALIMMNERGYRHLPVVDGDKVVGIISVRDLFASVQRELEEGIREREAFISGSGYGAG